MGSLGGYPRATARLLRGAGLRRRHRVIDLGCGKGAAAVLLARDPGCEVLGVDAVAGFLEEAAARAERLGIGRRCAFVVGDLHDAARRARGRYDAALMLGVAPLERARPIARSCVRPGGLYAIDDAFLVPERAPQWLRETGAPTREDCRRILLHGGDALLAEHVPTPAAIRRQNASLERRLALAARDAARREPALRPHLAGFLRRQRDAGRLLGSALRPCVWIVRRR